MMTKTTRVALFLILFAHFGYAISGDAPAEKDAPAEDAPAEKETSTNESALTGNIEAGEQRYKQSCINCHGDAGKGVASYPKISGQEISYTKSKLETYREGIKIGPNSSLMIMMAKPLTDEEIVNLAAYLKEATN